MNNPVPLIRRFTSIPDHYQDGKIALDEIWSILGRGERVEWQKLREAYRCIILADAGAGKTYELKAEAERMARRGRAAFFIRIEDIDDAFGEAFEVGTRAAFERWLDGIEEAWFFLDSVDEVRLEAPRAFETAVRAFANRIHDARQRAHVYISSRPYAWRPDIDRALIDELLPFDQRVIEAAGDEGENVRPGNDDTNPGDLHLYRLSPLDPDDIRIFAGHRGVTDVDGLMEALERTNLFGLAQLPFDLEDILAVWEDLGSLDSRLSVLEHGLQRRLSPPLDDTDALPLAKALDGARRLALAATLTGEGNIMMPKGTGVGLDTATVLPDWPEPERRELLGRGVFSDAIYGMVRFRHRENRELLAAQALAQKLRSGRREEIEDEIFRQVYGEAVIVPRMRPLLPWLILFDENVRKRTLALQPIIVTEGGDAARLPLDIRKKMLVDLVSNIATGESRGGDNGALARIAQLDLADEILRLLEEHWGNDDVIFFLGRLAWQGKMVAPAVKLSSIVLDPARGIYARIVSARAVLAVSGPKACSELWSALNQSGKTLSRRLLAELVEGAPATTTSVAHLLRSLEATPSLKRYDTSGLSQAIHNFIDRLPITGDGVPERPLVGLLEGFAEFLRRGPHIERRECKVSKDFHWLMASAMHTVERLIVGRSSACFEPAAMSVLSQIPALRNERGIEDREYKSKLDAHVPRWSALNDALFWHTVVNARAANAADAAAVDDDWAVSWLGHFWTFDSASFDRTLGWVTRCDIADDRLIALSRSFRTYAQNGRPRRWRRLLWRAVKGEPALEARLKMLMRPPASPERHRWRATERRWARRRRARELAEKEGRAALVARLKADPNSVRAPVSIKPGEMTWDQHWLLSSIEGDELRMSRSGGSDWRMLIPEFGEPVAEAFRDGALRHWRAYNPVLRSEGGDNTSIPYALVFAMAGLGMEAGRDGKGLTHLNREEVLHALRFSFSELNGFPSWLEPLYRVFPEEALALIWGETRWELNESQADRPLHYMMHDLVYHAPWLHKDLAPHIHDWFVDHGAPNDDCLRYGGIIMSGGGLPGTKLARLAKRRAEDPKTPESQLATWYAMWASLAPDDAIPALNIRLGALSRPDDAGFAERFIVALMGERAASGPSGSAWKTPEHLRTLYVLMHEHIRTSEDVKRPHGEVFERTKRDSAEDARSNLFGLLASIPGEESYRQILALANIHPDVGYRSHMRARAYQRAVTDSDRDWSVEDVVALD